MKLRIAAVDLVSNTCFPLLAADALGHFASEGVDVTIELIAAMHGTRALRSGDVDMVAAGSIYDILTEFPNWAGAKVVVALSHGSPWLLTVRSDLNAKRGDLNALKGLRLTAAVGPDLAFKQLLMRGGLDPSRDVNIIELPGARGRDVSFGVFAAAALKDGLIDGFWSNAMGAATAVNSGAGKILVDVRRGDDPGNVRRFTFAGIATTDHVLATKREALEAFVRAVVKTQKSLRANPALATVVGRAKFPPDAAGLIADTIERDVVFYNPSISEDMVDDLNAFAKSIGHLTRDVSYHHVVDAGFAELWQQ